MHPFSMSFGNTVPTTIGKLAKTQASELIAAKLFLSLCKIDERLSTRELSNKAEPNEGVTN